MRTVDMRKPQSTKRRLFGLRPPENTRPYVLSYEAVDRYGERKRYIRNLSQRGVELIGARLAQFPAYDQRVGNIRVTRPDLAKAGDPPLGPDVSEWFSCFTQPAFHGTPAQLQANLRMLTYEPPTDEPETETRTATQIYLDGGGDPANTRTMELLAEADRSISRAADNARQRRHEEDERWPGSRST